MKKKAKKSLIRVNVSNADRYDDLHVKLEGITSRLDGWNGAIPFIKEAVGKLQESVEVIHTKIDVVSQVNSQQDQRLARAEEITDWVRRVFIIGGSLALVSGLGAVIWKTLGAWLFN